MCWQTTPTDGTGAGHIKASRLFCECALERPKVCGSREFHSDFRCRRPTRPRCRFSLARLRSDGKANLGMLEARPASDEESGRFNMVECDSRCRHVAQN